VRWRLAAEIIVGEAGGVVVVDIVVLVSPSKTFFKWTQQHL
jgi:hypothetical protein